MTSVSLPDPVVRRTGPPRVDARALEVLTHDGERFWAGPTSDEEYAAIVAAGVAGLGAGLGAMARRRRSRG
jgi:hypothetical protein